MSWLHIRLRPELSQGKHQEPEDDHNLARLQDSPALVLHGLYAISYGHGCNFGLCRMEDQFRVLSVCDLCLTGIHLPLVITPRSNDFDIRSKCFDTKLETDLVISFSCSTVADCNSVFFSGDLYQFLTFSFF